MQTENTYWLPAPVVALVARALSPAASVPSGGKGAQSSPATRLCKTRVEMTCPNLMRDLSYLNQRVFSQ